MLETSFPDLGLSLPCWHHNIQREIKASFSWKRWFIIWASCPKHFLKVTWTSANQISALISIPMNTSQVYLYSELSFSVITLIFASIYSSCLPRGCYCNRFSFRLYFLRIVISSSFSELLHTFVFTAETLLSRDTLTRSGRRSRFCKSMEYKEITGLLNLKAAVWQAPPQGFQNSKWKLKNEDSRTCHFKFFLKMQEIRQRNKGSKKVKLRK